MFAIYDMEDNLIFVCDTYKELAKYFNTSVIVMHTTMSRIKSGIRKKKRTTDGKWCRIIRIEEEE